MNSYYFIRGSTDIGECILKFLRRVSEKKKRTVRSWTS